jgi:flagellar hook protein FlgE
VFTATNTSGSAVFNTPGQGSAGALQSKTLEASNVDVPTQLTQLVIAQNAYDTNSKLITTTDTMLQDLTQMLS